MRVARVSTSHGPRSAVHRGDAWEVFAEDLARPTLDVPLAAPTDVRVSDSAAMILPPCTPTVVLGMAHNSGDAGRALPPQAFMRSPRTVIPDGGTTLIDPSYGTVVVEGELAVVIGRRAWQITEEEADDVIFGWTIGGDLTYDDQVAADPMMTQSKNGRGFTPLGPWIETALSTDDVTSGLGIRLRIDGDVAAESSTSGLSYTVAEQLAYLTSYVELDAGDVVLTGCNRTSAVVAAGQRVSIEVDGIGALTHAVAVELGAA